MEDGPNLRRWTVPDAFAGLRLDRVLTEMWADVSRTELARWIEHGRVLIGDRVATRAAEKVRAGVLLTINPLPPPPSNAEPEADVVFAVLHVDRHIVVVDKPAGLVVHPARGHQGGTLVNGLLGRGLIGAPPPDASETDTSRPGIVHRIDKNTSGVLVVARTVRARERLKAAFAAHDIERVYDAVAVGTLPDELHLDTLHGRDPRNRLAFTSHVRAGKRAITHVRVIERLGGGTQLVECRLETGRTHQIRMHLSESGAPLLADELYGRRVRDPAVRTIEARLGRHALHARVLGFEHPIDKKHMRFESPWPADFEEAVRTLRELLVPTPVVRSSRRR